MALQTQVKPAPAHSARQAPRPSSVSPQQAPQQQPQPQRRPPRQRPQHPLPHDPTRSSIPMATQPNVSQLPPTRTTPPSRSKTALPVMHPNYGPSKDSISRFSVTFVWTIQVVSQPMVRRCRSLLVILGIQINNGSRAGIRFNCKAVQNVWIIVMGRQLMGTL